MANDTKTQKFQVDRTISIGLLITVAIQVVIIIWSASKLSENVRINSENMFRLQQKMEEFNRDHQDIRNDLYQTLNELRADTTELKFKIQSLEKKN